MEGLELKLRRPRPRVVMLVANNFQHDTRVYKQARSLIELGCYVHVIALYDRELPVSEEVDGIYVHRVAMRSDDLWRLGTVVLMWWCGPALRRLVGSPREEQRLDAAGDRDTPSEESERGRFTFLRRWLVKIPGLRWTARTVVRAFRLVERVRARLVQMADWVATSLWTIVRAVYRASLKKRARPRKIVNSLFVLCWRMRRTLKFALRWRMRRTLKGPIRRDYPRVIHRLNCRNRALIRTVVLRCTRLVPPSLRLLAMNLQFARHAIDLQPDVVQSHDLNTLLGGTLVKRLTGVGLVYDSHELFLKRNIGNKSRARGNLIWAPVERFCIGKCDAVLSVAQGICDYLATQYGIFKPHLIRNVQPFEPPRARTTILADELGIPDGRRIVIYPGAITINRGLEVMIDSAPHLNGAAYVIMGYARNADYLASLKQRATKLGVMSSSVFFREAVPINDVVRYVASADLGIVPTQNVCLSYFFESSNKIFHCVMAGVPVVMSDHCEKRLLVETYGIGALFDETDPMEIARVVSMMLDDREAYAAHRCNCLEAARVLNWEHEQYTLRRVFADLLGDRALPIPEITIEPLGATGTSPLESTKYATTQ